MPSAIAWPVADHTSAVDADQCGVRMTLSRPIKGSSAGSGSPSKTSRPSAGDSTVAQGGDERLLIDELAAPDVDEVRRFDSSAPIEPHRSTGGSLH